MKKLDRTIADTPICLNNLSFPTHNWDNMSKKGKNGVNRKSQVWVELDKFQNKLCVYCESKAYQGKYTGHIEHFFDKGNPLYENLVLDWSNLFGCCASTTHCGHYKDQVLGVKDGVNIKREYDFNFLLKPDVDNPKDYLQYLPNGTIKPKNGLIGDQEKKAKETIRALNLLAPELKVARENQITLYKNQVNNVIELLTEESDADIISKIWDEYYTLKQEAESIPYRSAVEQAIQWL